MKKLFLLILSLQILTSGQFVNEVIKLNNLVQHFLDHRNNNQRMNLAEFIYLHYFDENHQKKDPKNHDALPLHHCNCLNHNGFNACLNSQSFDFFQPGKTRVLTPRNVNLFHQSTVQTIFQPPRQI